MSTALSLLLAATLLASALAKALDPGALRSTLETVMARRPAAVLGLVVPAVEAVLAVALLAGAGDRGRVPAAAVIGLLAVFTAALEVLKRRSVPCRCFGAPAAGGHTAGQVRNAGLAGAAAVLLLAPAGTVLDAGAGEALGAATVALGVACAWLLATALAREAAA